MTGARRAAGNETPVPYPAPVDDGFTLVETMVSIFVVGVVMAALTAFFVNTLALTNRQSGTQTASQVATDAIATIRSIRGSALATGRDSTSSTTQWNAAKLSNDPPGVAGYLASTDMVMASDSTAPTGAGATAALPTSAVNITLSNMLFKQFFYLGACWQPVAGGACTPPPACYPSCTPAQMAGYVPFYRAVVAITWPDRTCAASQCSFVTSTLVSSTSTDPLFNSNNAATAPTTTSPGNQSGFVNSTVSLQLTSTGGANPTSWSFTGLPNGLVGSSSGLITGTLAGPAGVYPVTATATDAFGMSGASTFNWTVQLLAYPLQVGADNPWAYYRSDEAVSAAATSAAADSSGNSRPGTYTGKTNGPTLHWDFNEGSGTVLHDSSGAGHDGTVTSNGGWSTGLMGSGGLAGLTAPNGADQAISNPDPPVRVDQSFTLSLWTNMTATSTINRGIANMTGKTSGSTNPRSDFAVLYDYNGGTPRWGFWMAQDPTSSTNATWDKASGTSAVAINSWTHLTAVYDTSVAGGTIYLYVNGTLEATTTHTPLNNSLSSVGLDLGRYRSSSWGYTYNGAYDEVRTYRRALSSTEIGNLTKSQPESRWDFSEAAGATTTADSGANGNTGTLGSAASFVAGHVGNALSMSNSANGYMQTAARAVSTDANFSVSAWVYLSSSGTGTTRAVVAEHGVNTSNFIIEYNANGKWRMSWPRTDTNGVVDDYLESTAAATTNTWVHLVGVLDGAAGLGRLYVNGTQVDSNTQTLPGTWSATSPLQVGRAWWNGAYTFPWYGKIDSVRTYQRTLTTTEISNLYADTDPAAPFTDAAMTAGLPGALVGAQQASTAVAFNGTKNAYSNTLIASPGPAAFTIECWFKIASGDAGTLISYSTVATGLGGNYDRLIYVDTSGKIRFGVNPGTTVTVVSPQSYDDGTWHHVAASLGSAGMKLYLDGTLVDTNPGTTTAGSYAGYWRWGGNAITGWPFRPNNGYLTGTLDEVAIYNSQLSNQRISDHDTSNQ